MTYNERKQRLNELWYSLSQSGKVANKKELAERIGVSYSSLTNAFGTHVPSLTNSLLRKVEDYTKELLGDDSIVMVPANQVPLLPIEARGGSLSGFSEAVMPYHCEMIQSPVKDADYAIQVTGDSMAPDYPSGSHVFIKKVNEAIFIEWGRVYVLDTANGIIIKEVQPTPDEEVVKCISINPKYPAFTIRKEHIYGWYAVLLSMSLK